VTPLERTRIEKAAADCGFELMPVPQGEGLLLHSARFPETVVVAIDRGAGFQLTASSPLMVDAAAMGPASVALPVGNYAALYSALQRAAAAARTLPNRVADQFRAQVARMPATTEAERLVVLRVGQNLFRDALLDYWQGACCVTGLAVPTLLRASHIKPWALCADDNERLDVFNGLLLAPHLDALFDGGWMTVNDDGLVVISPQLPHAARVSLGAADARWHVGRLTAAHRQYLTFHRQSVFRR
jgi:putative restriction endonuclease